MQKPQLFDEAGGILLIINVLRRKRAMSEGNVQSVHGPISPGSRRPAQAGARRVLVIDGDRDMCELLVLALTKDGYSVDCGLSCQEALGRLKERRYGLVISDYELPDGTAATWIAQATRAGWLKSAPVLIATAHPDPPEVGHLEILRKPFDLEQLLHQVRRITELGRAARRAKRDRPFSERTVELVLYVTAGTIASERAQHHIGVLTRGCAAGTCSFVVREVTVHSGEAEADHIVFTPTLVKRHPGPPTWVIGDQALQAQLAALLEVWGVTGHE